MGTEVGRIEKEFVFRSLVDNRTTCDVHGNRREFRCVFASIDEKTITLTPLEGVLEGVTAGDEVRVFFYTKNNYHTFVSRVKEADGAHLLIDHPFGVYKNLQRKYERVQGGGDIDVSFTLRGTRVELNFPKSDRYSPVRPPDENATFDPRRIQELVRTFRKKMEALTTDYMIVMMRDRMPRAWEERTIVRLGKCLWIPSTAEDFPLRDPFPDERVITRTELVKLEEEAGARPYLVTSRLGNILYEKTKRGIVSELWVPVLYNEYVIGYIHVWNTAEKRERISRETFEFVHQFAKILCYSLVTNGYFKVENSSEQHYEAPIIDISAAGLLFAHTSPELAKGLLVHADLTLSVKVEKRVLTVGARTMRKFHDAVNSYFGVLYLKIRQEDFEFLFQYLYGKPFDPSLEGTWEGGAPPPPLNLD